MTEINRPKLEIRDYPELDNIQQCAIETLIAYYNNGHMGFTAIIPAMTRLGLTKAVELEFANGKN